VLQAFVTTLMGMVMGAALAVEPRQPYVRATSATPLAILDRLVFPNPDTRGCHDVDR
jgi:hypothetical protein